MAKRTKEKGIFHRLSTPDSDLTTDIRSAILAQSPKGGRYILWLLLVLVIMSFYWASVSEVAVVTRATGKVIPSRQIQVVQNLEGGILSQILVAPGEIVKKGQLLLRIDATRFSVPYRENRHKDMALKAKVARLQAEAQGIDFKIPPEVTKDNPKIAEREKELFYSRKQELDTGIAILQEQLNQRKQQLAELKAKRQQLTRSNQLLNKELQMTRPLVSQGAVSQVEMLRLERQANKMAGDLEATKLQIPAVESQYQEAKQAIEEKRLSFQNAAKVELNEVLSELESISVSSVALEDRLKRTQVRSPVYGTINRILVNTIGGVIQPGMDLIEIVPLEDTLLIEAKIKPSDIAFLRPDQEAQVRFSAYDFTVYGGLKAKLEHISPDTITDMQGRSFFLIRVRTDKNYLGTAKHPMPIIPGMVATVDILTGKKTILSYLLKPVLRAQKLALRER